ncbi:MAG TPA: hypothetical protein VHE13_18165 [Opitutus sp.]|nr:hypothetical protein [Opitutus sp.]
MTAPAVLRALLNFFHRPAIRFGLARDGGRRFRDPRFVSFLSESNRSRPGTDLHDALLRGRKLARQLLLLTLAGGAAWVLVESARALTLF